MSNLSHTEIKDKVFGVLRTYVEDVEITGDISLDELGLDSFKAIYLLLDLEEALNIQIPDTMLTPEIFTSPNSLQKAVTSILEN